MTAEACRSRRESLGSYLLGRLPDDERAALEAHLEGCPQCRAEAASLEPLVQLLPLADPARVEAEPAPPADLGDRIARQIKAEQGAVRRRRVRWRLGWAGAATAGVAAALIAVVLASGGGSQSSPSRQVSFASLPPGVEINAALEPRSFGTQIHMWVHGVSSGTLCRVFLRRANGTEVPAGTFSYRWGDDSGAVLSSALDLSRARAIVVRAGPHTYSAPLSPTAAS